MVCSVKSISGTGFLCVTARSICRSIVTEGIQTGSQSTEQADSAPLDGGVDTVGRWVVPGVGEPRWSVARLRVVNTQLGRNAECHRDDGHDRKVEKVTTSLECQATGLVPCRAQCQTGGEGWQIVGSRGFGGWEFRARAGTTMLRTGWHWQGRNRQQHQRREGQSAAAEAGLGERPRTRRCCSEKSSRGGRSSRHRLFMADGGGLPCFGSCGDPHLRLESSPP